jgi:hypothetical protein
MYVQLPLWDNALVLIVVLHATRAVLTSAASVLEVMTIATAIGTNRRVNQKIKDLQQLKQLIIAEHTSVAMGKLSTVVSVYHAKITSSKLESTLKHHVKNVKMTVLQDNINQIAGELLWAHANRVKHVDC